MYEWFTGGDIDKAIGSVAGSGLAAWCMRSARWAFDIVCGVTFGIVFGGFLIQYMGWPDTRDSFLAVGGILGLMGSRLVQLILNRSLWRFILTAIQTRISKL